MRTGEVERHYLVEEGHVYESIVEHQGSPGSEQLSKQRPHADPVVVCPALRTERETQRDILELNGLLK